MVDRKKAWGIALAFAVMVVVCALRYSEVRGLSRMAIQSVPDAKKPVVEYSMTVPAPLPWLRPLFSKPTGSPTDLAGRDHPNPVIDAGTNQPRLIGIIWASDGGMALVDLEGKKYRLTLHSAVGRWNVARIDRRSITLEAEQKHRTLSLEVPGAAK